MNSMNNTLSGLASSLFLNVGLTRIAEKLDPMPQHDSKSILVVDASGTCVSCNACDCNFSPETGL